MIRGMLVLVCLLFAAPALAQDGTPEPTPDTDAPTTLILATTTSTVDSGLLDAILPVFEEQYGADVAVLSVGSGQAFELGRNGDTDVLLVHDRDREDTFVEEGYGTARADVMFNNFVILGPTDDPAGIRGMTSAAEAFTQIAAAEAIFVSRGDDSGTHSRERRIWETAALTPEGDWYIEAGQGMGAVLNMSNELQGYTLSDRATYIARAAEGLELEVLVEGDPLLLNPYGVLPVNPERFPVVNAELAQAFADWITSVEAQQLIADFRLNDQPLFTPNSEQWLAAQAEATAEPTVEPTAEATPGS